MIKINKNNDLKVRCNLDDATGDKIYLTDVVHITDIEATIYTVNTAPENAVRYKRSVQPLNFGDDFILIENKDLQKLNEGILTVHLHIQFGDFNLITSDNTVDTSIKYDTDYYILK